MYDIIIIGGGPAGMTAAVYAARKKLKVLLATIDFGGQPMWTRAIENYMGYQYITGPELITKFEEQVSQFPIEKEFYAVTEIKVQDEGDFSIIAGDKSYIGKAVIIASGKSPNKLGVPDEKEFLGKDVSYCATCDGPLFSDKIVAVIGGGNSGVQAALELSKYAKKVWLIERNEFKADKIVLDKAKKTDNIEILLNYFPKNIIGNQLYIIH